MHTLFLIQIYSLIPFILVFIGFFIIGCTRKFGDFYLKRSIGYLVAAVVLRIVICSTIIIMYLLDRLLDLFKHDLLLEIKMQTISV